MYGVSMTNSVFDVWIADHGYDGYAFVSHAHEDHIPAPIGLGTRFNIVVTPDDIIDYKIRMEYARMGFSGIKIIHSSSIDGVEIVRLRHFTIISWHRYEDIGSYAYYIKRDRALLVSETEQLIDDILTSYNIKRLYIQSQPIKHLEVIKRENLANPLIMYVRNKKTILPIKTIESLFEVEEVRVLIDESFQTRSIRYIAVHIGFTPKILPSIEDIKSGKIDMKKYTKS